MKIDKKMLDGLLGLSDEKLLLVLRSVTGGMFSGKEPDMRSVAGLRAALGQVTEDDIDRAAELIELYKKGKRT